MRTKVAVCTLIAAMMLAFTGCGEKGIDGRWIKTRIIEKDGTVITGKDIGPAEIYMIEGDRAKYSTSLDVNGKDITIDCSQLEYIASSGLRILLGLLKSAKANGNKVVLKSLNDEIKDVFKMTGFIDLFNIE